MLDCDGRGQLEVGEAEGLLAVVVGQVPHQLRHDRLGGCEDHRLLRFVERVAVPAVGAAHDLIDGHVGLGVQQVGGALAQDGVDVHLLTSMKSVSQAWASAA